MKNTFVDNFFYTGSNKQSNFGTSMPNECLHNARKLKARAQSYDDLIVI